MSAPRDSRARTLGIVAVLFHIPSFLLFAAMVIQWIPMLVETPPWRAAQPWAVLRSVAFEVTVAGGIGAAVLALWSGSLRARTTSMIASVAALLACYGQFAPDIMGHAAIGWFLLALQACGILAFAARSQYIGRSQEAVQVAD